MKYALAVTLLMVAACGTTEDALDPATPTPDEGVDATGGARDVASDWGLYPDHATTPPDAHPTDVSDDTLTDATVDLGVEPDGGPAELNPEFLADLPADDIGALACDTLDEWADAYVEASRQCSSDTECNTVWLAEGCDCARGWAVSDRYLPSASHVVARARECALANIDSRFGGYCTSDAAPVDVRLTCVAGQCSFSWPQSCLGGGGADAGSGY